MRLLICAGGTGGGVYPALAVLQALASADPQLETLWVGGVGGMEADLVKRAGVPFTAIPAAGVAGVGARALPGNLWKLGRGLLASRRVLRQFRPNALLFTGGYLAVPMALAARMPARSGTRPRSLLYVPDIEPGLALKTITRFADLVALTTSDSLAYFPKGTRVEITGYPVRPGMVPQEQSAARRSLNLEPGLPVLMVMGGSKGAHSINRALLAALPELLKEMQVLHVSGQLDWEDVQQAAKTLDESVSSRYHPYPYLHEEMAAAYSAADMIVTRAGASTLGELPLFGLPAVLVPYPYAWRYQQVNARYLESHGAALILQDVDLAEKLPSLVSSLMNDTAQRRQMQQSMRALAHPEAAQSIGALLKRLASSKQNGGESSW